MKKLAVVIAFAATALIPGHSFAEHHLGHEMNGQASVTAKCPVSGEDVNVKDAKWVYEYKGKKYYFCMKSCEDQFKKNPEKYLKKAGSKK